MFPDKIHLVPSIKICISSAAHTLVIVLSALFLLWSSPSKLWFFDSWLVSCLSISAIIVTIWVDILARVPRISKSFSRITQTIQVKYPPF